MGEEDVRRQKLNVFKMKALGTEVVSVTQRQPDPARRHQRGHARLDGHASRHTHYIIGSVVGPHPFPMMVRDFQSVIGQRDARSSAWNRSAGCPTSSWPASAAAATRPACFIPFVGDASVELVGVEAGGRGAGAGEHAATLSHGQPGVLHGTFSYVLQDDDGQTADGAFGLGRAWIIPASAPSTATGRTAAACATPASATPRRWRRFDLLLAAGGHPAGPGNGPCRGRGACAWRPSAAKEDVVVVCFSGRGDKDCFEVARLAGRRHRIVAGCPHEPHRRLVSAACVAKAARRSFPSSPPAIPTSTATVGRWRATLAVHGASLLEIGFPYSDPIADGPVIQASYTRALDRGLKLDDMFGCVRRIAALPEVTERQMPLVAMVSFSLVHRRGAETFLDQAAEAGFSGAIVPGPAARGIRGAGRPGRRPRLQAHSAGDADDAARPRRRDRPADRPASSIASASPASPANATDCRRNCSTNWRGCATQTDLPLCVGFGVSKPEHVRMLRDAADGVIVGSALVRKLEEAGKRPLAEVVAAMGELAESLSEALNGGE